jgi:ABC-2 type transport system ATP-binding protein
MKSKVALCAAFIGSPRLIILDEPTNGLDPMSVYNMKDLLAEFAGNGGTILISSHILDFVEKICTRFAVIGKGQIKSMAIIGDLKEKDISLEDFFMSSMG